MSIRLLDTLPSLYDRDETAWLEAMAELAGDGRGNDLDLPHLAEYLSDMARRDRREVESRLVLLLAHLLKWGHQPDHRSRSWLSTVIEQRQELNRLAGRGVLRNHAEEVLAQVYPEAVERAAAETGLSLGRFPAECSYTFDQLLAIQLPEERALSSGGLGVESMGHRNPLRIRNGGDRPMVVVVEPWASEFELPSGAECEVVATHPETWPTLGVEPLDGLLVVWVNDDRSSYEFWRDGVQLD